MLALFAACALTLMGAKGCENPNPQGVTDTGSVVGTVVDAKTPTQPVQSATIQIGVQVTRLSPADQGKFTLNGVPTGTQTVQISSPGYGTYSTQVIVRKGQTSDIGVIGLASTTGL